jgi:hypothetical protein
LFHEELKGVEEVRGYLSSTPLNTSKTREKEITPRLSGFAAIDYFFNSK